ncbi:PPOX class F420-dependent oxidoreductase [Nocardioides marmoraquaticus]
MPRTRTLEGEHLDFWRERHLCTLTTLGADGDPHVVPVGAVIDLDGSDDGEPRAWVITSAGVQKTVNARRDPRVAICQVDGRRWSTVYGTAEVLDDPASVAEAERRYAERYRQPRENPERVALRVSITRVVGNV